MIVYGDPAYQADLGELVDRLRCRWETVHGTLPTERHDGLVSRLSRLDALRSLLVQAGQLEQAVADTHPDLSELRSIEAVTSRVADAFVACYCGAAAAMTLDAPCSLPPLPIGKASLKIPEGFAFYTLYPEQYIRAARDWMCDHADAPSRESVVVVGIRSIGTTLSAVVTSILKRRGWNAHRVTVRPIGHPFERRADIAPHLIRDAAYGLVVDEGPGLSGSSMTAAAAALERAGIERGRIAFLPGHPHDPGHAASSEVQAWWANTPRYAARLDQLRWDGLSIEELIATLTPKMLGTTDCIQEVEDLSAGRWREAVYDSPADWPAMCGMFERTKYRCVCVSGAAALWKFVGFVDLSDPTPNAQLMHGFEVSPWIEGRPLWLEDRNDSILEQIARYIIQSAGPVVSGEEHRAARARLQHMLYWNTREALGEEAAARVEAWSKSVEPLPNTIPSYTDGHMAPHEWLRTPAGRIVKTDCTGHVTDHTIVGRQPLLWELAGAIVEWNLDELSMQPLLRAWRESELPPFSPDTLAWYEAAYAAFRLGQCTLCAQAAGAESDEMLRLRTAGQFYERQLRSITAVRCGRCC